MWLAVGRAGFHPDRLHVAGGEIEAYHGVARDGEQVGVILTAKTPGSGQRNVGRLLAGRHVNHRQPVFRGHTDISFPADNGQPDKCLFRVAQRDARPGLTHGQVAPGCRIHA